MGMQVSFLLDHFPNCTFKGDGGWTGNLEKAGLKKLKGFLAHLLGGVGPLPGLLCIHRLQHLSHLLREPPFLSSVEGHT